MSVIATNLKWIRKKQNISQTEFANVFGITRASVGAYEEARAEPKLELLMKITKHYHLELSAFIEDDLNGTGSINIPLSKSSITARPSTSEDSYIQEILDIKPASPNIVRNNAQSSLKKKTNLKENTIPFYKSAKNKELIAISNWPFFENCDAVFECNPLMERLNPIYKDGFIFLTSKIEQEGIYMGTFIQKDGNRLILSEDELMWDSTSVETWKVIYIIESISNFKL